MLEYRWLHEIEPSTRGDVSRLYVEAFTESLELVAPRLDAWIEWSSGALTGSHTLVALVDGTVAAAISCSAPGCRNAVTVQLAPLMRAFGAVRGAIAYRVMSYEFSGPLPRKVATMPYIELLAVAPSFQRRGLARALIRELTLRLGYPSYSIQVDDSNHAGRALYSSLGFFEVTRINEPWKAAQKAGTMERVFMLLNVSDAPAGGSPDV